MTLDQLKRLKKELKTHFKGELTETKLSEAIANYNRNGFNHSILIYMNTVIVSNQLQGDIFGERFTNTNNKIDAMVKAIGYVMINSQQGNTFTFNFGGFK
jgi:hypothetical protein